jgi:hypothetical protein
MLHSTELSCALLSYPIKLHCTLLSYAASYHSHAAPQELLCTLYANLHPSELPVRCTLLEHQKNIIFGLRLISYFYSLHLYITSCLIRIKNYIV